MLVAESPQARSDSLDLVILGDGASNVSSVLQKLLLQAPQSDSQSQFIRHAGVALGAHFQRLYPNERESLPCLTNIHDFVRIYQETDGRCHPAISSVLLCVTQLLQLFRYYEEHSRSQGIKADTALVGFCTGSLAAAAYAASSSLYDLKLLAVPVVVMAFQMGLEAATASSIMYEQGDQLRSWSLVVPRMTEDEAVSALQLDDGADDSRLHQQCFVSAVGVSSVTISGPPPALDRFAENLRSSQPCRKMIWIPIFAGYHAPHIHGKLDFSGFLSRCAIEEDFLASFKPSKKLLSPRTGEPLQTTSASGLFQAVVQDTLQAPLRLDRIVDVCARLIHERDISSVSVDVVEPTSTAGGLATALRSRSTATISTRNLVAIGSNTNESRPSTPFDQAPLAIVGMSGRFPGADSVEALWSVLEAGLDLHRVIPEDRFDVDTHVDPTGKANNTSWTPYGCFIDRPGDFDPRFFNLSPREALQTDPMQRLALVTAYEALEMAGFVPGRTRSTMLNRVGTFYGQTSDDYRDVNAAQEIGTYFITGGIRAFGPGRINYFFKFGGPSFNIDTACSSGLAAIQIACTSLWSGDCDTAVAGGLSVLTSPDLYSGLSRGQFLSRTGSCKTFDESADGYCRADGVGSIVIKRLSDAIADRDNILGVVRATATNHSANAVSLTHPHAETQSALYRDVLHRAGVDALDVSYIEMHGTGTQAGDGMEMRSVMDVFAPEKCPRGDDNPLHVGALKANIGHGEASAGVSSLIKALLVLQKGSIPPHVGIKTELNKGFPDLKARNVHIPLGKTPFPKKDKKRHILVNNFGAAGGNTALLLEEAPPVSIKQDMPSRAVHPVTVSGHTQSALRNNLERLIVYLGANPQTSLADLSYTTTARRRHHALRVTVTESSIETTRVALEQKLQTTPPDDPHPQSPVFVFTGQGAAYPALARELYMTTTQFRADMDHFNEITIQHGFPPVISLVTGTVSKLDQLSPIQMQVGLVCVQMALARLWGSWGIKPAAVIGHSLGEYAALQVSGVLSVSDTIYLVGSRARLLENRCEMHSHAMLAVGDSTTGLQNVPPNLMARVEIACVNSLRETVLAGPNEAVDELAAFFESRSNIRCKKLPVPYAFHSAQVDPILEEFEAIASRVHMWVPRIPILSSLRGRVLGAADSIDAGYLREHCRRPVRFSDALQHAQQMHLLHQASTVALEIGPHPICSAMVRQVLGNQTQTLPTLRRNTSPWTVMAGSLAALHDRGASINWSEYHRDQEAGCRLLTLPAYAFDNKNYWIKYTNDWTLRKGDPPPSSASAANPAPPAARLSASVHRVVEERYDGSHPVAIFETDLGTPEVHAAIRGHRVNNSGLCPASLYADVALTIARHIQQHPESGFSLSGHNITGMEVHQGLIVNSSVEEETRILRVHAHLDVSSQTIKLEYASVDPAQKSPTSHATCAIEFEDSENWLRRWARDSHLIHDRIASLQEMADAGKINKVTTGLAYRLFSALVDYMPEYRRMDQILFDAPRLEAATTVKLDDRGTDSAFLYSPYWLDSLMHITGFVMNGNDTLNHHEAVYIAHGWETLRIAGPLDSNRSYKSYVRMLPDGKNMVAGNVWVLCDGEVVGLVENVQFQRVPRAVLDLLLRPPGGGEKSTTTTNHSRKSAAAQKKAPSPAARQTTVTRTDDSSRRGGPAVLDVVASELGVAASEISLGDRLANLGVDSLMSLALAGRLLESFDVSISHTQMTECTTVGDLLSLVDHQQRGGGLEQQLAQSEPPVPVAAAVCQGSPSTSSQTSAGGAGTFTPDSSTDGDTLELVRAMIIEETGIAPDDLSPSVDLGHFGVDSLMSLVILGRLRDDGVELPNHFFRDNRTMNDVEKALSGESRSQPPMHEAPKMASATAAAPTIPDSCISRLILLQKRSNPAGNQTLFLFPVGSGSPSLYSFLEPFGPDFDVYGLVCPFIDKPDSYTCDFKGLVAIYVTAIRNQQPHGPYHFGGMSIGGILAYEAAKQLTDAGEDVASLLLMDAPCPLVLPPMPMALIDYTDNLGLLGEEPIATKEKRLTATKHRYVNVQKLAEYKPEPISSSSSAPQTLLIWATKGARDPNVHPDPDFCYDKNNRGSIERWVLDDRTEFGPYGWDVLIPVAKMVIKTTPGNHYDFDLPPNGSILCGHMQKFMSRFQSSL